MAESVQERLKLKRTILDTWSTREKLSLASLVLHSGDQNWSCVSRNIRLFAEPNRPPDWFSPRNCAQQYASLLENVETPKRKKRIAGSSEKSEVETPGESIVRKLKADRIEELKKKMDEIRIEYLKVKNASNAIISGEADDKLPEMLQEIEDEKKKKELEKEAHVKWLKEREERKIELERAWKPCSRLMNIRRASSMSEPSSEADSPLSEPLNVDVLEEYNLNKPTPTSPLLTSLLKSPSTVGPAQSSAQNSSSILHTAITSPHRGSSPTIASLLSSSPGLPGNFSMPPSNMSSNLKNFVSNAIANSFNEEHKIVPQTPSQGAPTLSMLLELPPSLPGKPLPMLKPQPSAPPPYSEHLGPPPPYSQATEYLQKQRAEQLAAQSQSAAVSTAAAVTTAPATTTTSTTTATTTTTTATPVAVTPKKVEPEVATPTETTSSASPSVPTTEAAAETTVMTTTTTSTTATTPTTTTAAAVVVAAAAAATTTTTAVTTTTTPSQPTTGRRGSGKGRRLETSQVSEEGEVEEPASNVDASAASSPVREKDGKRLLHNTPDHDYVETPTKGKEGETPPAKTESKAAKKLEMDVFEFDEVKEGSYDLVMKESKMSYLKSNAQRMKKDSDGNGQKKAEEVSCVVKIEETTTEEVEEKAPSPVAVAPAAEEEEEEEEEEEDGEEGEGESEKGTTNDDDIPLKDLVLKKEGGEEAAEDTVVEEKPEKEPESKESATPTTAMTTTTTTITTTTTTTATTTTTPVSITTTTTAAAAATTTTTVTTTPTPATTTTTTPTPATTTSTTTTTTTTTITTPSRRGCRNSTEERKESDSETKEVPCKRKAGAESEDESKPAKKAPPPVTTVEVKVDRESEAEAVAEVKAPEPVSNNSDDSCNERRKSEETGDQSEEEKPEDTDESETTKDYDASSSAVDIKSEKTDLSTTEDEKSNDAAPKVYSRRRGGASFSDSVPNSPAPFTEEEKEYKAWKRVAMLVYTRLAGHKFASLFLKPITDEQAPGYSSIVRRPMDLSSVKRNIELGNIRTTAEFQRDVMLMFTNALMYNERDHHVYGMAKEMQADSKEHFQMLLQVTDENTPSRRETRTQQNSDVKIRTVEKTSKVGRPSLQSLHAAEGRGGSDDRSSGTPASEPGKGRGARIPGRNPCGRPRIHDKPPATVGRKRAFPGAAAAAANADAPKKRIKTDD